MELGRQDPAPLRAANVREVDVHTGDPEFEDRYERISNRSSVLEASVSFQAPKESFKEDLPAEVVCRRADHIDVAVSMQAVVSFASLDPIGSDSACDTVVARSGIPPIPDIERLLLCGLCTSGREQS